MQSLHETGMRDVQTRTDLALQNFHSIILSGVWYDVPLLFIGEVISHDLSAHSFQSKAKVTVSSSDLQNTCPPKVDIPKIGRFPPPEAPSPINSPMIRNVHCMIERAVTYVADISWLTQKTFPILYPFY